MTYRCQACKRHFRVEHGHVGRRATIFVSVAVTLLAVAGLAIALFADHDSEVNYQPRVDVSDTDAVSRVLQAAKSGNHQAEYDLGWTYWQRGEHQRALPWVKAAADHGHAEAEYLLGVAYLNGRGTVQNYRFAHEQFAKAAYHGHLEAQYELGVFYRDGVGTTPSRESAYLWLNIAAARGHGEALRFRDKLAAIMTAGEIARAQDASAQTMAKLAGASASPRKP